MCIISCQRPLPARRAGTKVLGFPAWQAGRGARVKDDHRASEKTLLLPDKPARGKAFHASESLESTPLRARIDGSRDLPSFNGKPQATSVPRIHSRLRLAVQRKTRTRKIFCRKQNFSGFEVQCEMLVRYMARIIFLNRESRKSTRMASRGPYVKFV